MPNLAGEDVAPIREATPEELEEERKRNAFWTSGADFGRRMRDGSMRPTQGAWDVDKRGLSAAMARSRDSYGLQRGSLDQIRAQAMGQGPSVANIRGAMAQDQIMRGMTGADPQSLRAALMGGAGNQAAAQLGQARSAEINSANDLFASGAGQMRGQSLQDYGQGLSNAYRSADLNLRQQGQNIERELGMQKLGLAADQAQAGFNSDLYDALLGQYTDQMGRGMQQFGAWTGLASGAAGGIANYGLSRSYDPGPSHWGPGAKQTDLMSWGRQHPGERY